MSGWSVAAWALATVGRPVLGTAVGAGSAAALVRKLPDVPAPAAFRLAALGNLLAGDRSPLRCAAPGGRSSPSRRCARARRGGRSRRRRRRTPSDAAGRRRRLPVGVWRGMMRRAHRRADRPGDQFVAGTRRRLLRLLGGQRPAQPFADVVAVVALPQEAVGDAAEADREHRTRAWRRRSASRSARTLTAGRRAPRRPRRRPVNPRPMPWAKRFGGPGTNRCSTAQPRRDHTGGELTERAERRPGEHAGREAVDERHQHPPLPERQEHDRLQHHAGRHHARRGLVDRIGELEQPTHRRRTISRQTRLVPLGYSRRARSTRSAQLPSWPMTIRLSVDRTRWWAHVADVAEPIDGLVPVVKGNGYGFGRAGLAIAAAELSPLSRSAPSTNSTGCPTESPRSCSPRRSPARCRPTPVLTVGNRHHVDALARLGRAGDRQAGVVDAPVRRRDRAGRRRPGRRAAHRRRGDPSAARRHRRRAPRRDRRLAPAHRPEPRRVGQPPLPPRYAALPRLAPYRLRLGTYLWHGDARRSTSTPTCSTCVRCAAGSTAGYRQAPRAPATATW